MTDPTPRTAATAREYAPCKAGPGYVHFDPAMVAKCLICTPCTHASYTTRTTCDRCHQTAAEAPGRVAALEAAFRITRDELMDWEHHEDCEVWQHYDREPSAAEGPCDCSLAGLVNRLTLAIGENDRG